MKRPYATLLLIRALTLMGGIAFVASGKSAAENSGVESPSPNLAARLLQVPGGLELSEEQKRLVKSLIEEYEPKLAHFQADILNTLTKDQRVARAAAFRESRKGRAGGKAIRDASLTAFDLSEEQEQQLARIRKEKSRIKRELLQRFHALLSDEQRVIIDDQQGGRKSRPDARVIFDGSRGRDYPC